MSSTLLRKQYVIDEAGNHIGVILPMADYLTIEPLLRQREQKAEPAHEHRRKRLQLAAEVMREEYAKGKELTMFTALDGEDFLE